MKKQKTMKRKTGKKKKKKQKVETSRNVSNLINVNGLNQPVKVDWIKK